MPFTKTYIKDLCYGSAPYQKGLAYYNEGRVTLNQTVESDDGNVEYHTTVIGKYKYDIMIKVNYDGELIGQLCNCPAYSQYSGICKHIVATMLYVMAEVNDSEKAIRTSSIALHMLETYAQRRLMGSVILSSKSISVIPFLNAEDDTARVSFKIGSERMYVMKDISEFVYAVSNNVELHYGKNFSIIPTLDCFDEESKNVVNFISKYFHSQSNSIMAGKYYYNSVQRDFYLSPFMLDNLLLMYQDKKLNISPQYGSTDDYIINNDNPHLKIHIKEEKNGYCIYLNKDFSRLKGTNHLYLLDEKEKILYLCDDKFEKDTMDFLDAIYISKNRKLVIAASEMTTVAANLLPTLAPHFSIISDADISAFTPPPLQSRVYFDMPSPAVVTGRVEFQYGTSNPHDGFKMKVLHEALDLQGEALVENTLRRYFPDVEEKGTLIIDENDDKLFSLVNEGVPEISRFAEVFVTDAFKSMRVKPPATVSVGVKVESDLLRLNFDIQGVDLSELAELLTSYRKAKKYHRLRDGSFINLEGSTLSEFSELAQNLDLSAKDIMNGNVSVSKYRALYLDSLLKQSERIQYDRDGSFKQIIRDMRDIKDADFAIPKSLRSILRNYQKVGYRWMRTLAAYNFGGILADDMGLGKTLQVIALLLAEKAEGNQSISLVVCPSSLVFNWENEVHKFAPNIKVLPISGSAAEREAQLSKAYEYDLLVTSYDLLKRDVEHYIDFSFQYLIADEAQYMKNQNTQNAKAIKTLKSSVRLALTGTPVENSLSEVWSIFDFLMPGYLYHYAKFRKNFEQPIVRQNDEKAAQSLRQMVSPFILRRMKSEVLKELPEKLETVVYAEFDDVQHKLYLANAAEAKKKFASSGDSGTDKIQILAMLTRLRQLCCDPALVYENYKHSSAKLELCIELLQSCIESGHRVLLFSQFTSMLSRIANRLNELDITYFTITGETKSSGRLDLVNDFNEGDTPVFLISLKAGGTGLNLTGADVVIHYDPWWNSSAQNQATDRAYRIGQTKKVQVYKLIAKNTIEERILDMQQSKSDLADMIVREGDGAFARMSKNEILALFE